jgi:hypothetical protein
MPSPRFNHGKRNDVFISYTWADDEPDPAGRNWVSKFEADLQRRLAAVSGRSIEVWRDKTKLATSDRFDKEIADQIDSTAVLVPILSPGYFYSDYCRQERDEFREVAPDIGNKARIVKVAKTHVDLSVYPNDLRTLNEYRFYVEEPGPVFRSFEYSKDQAVRDLYATVIDDVAWEISKILGLMEPAAAPSAHAGTVFLAEASPDLEEPRNALRRSLFQRGYEVLPEAPLRLSAAQLRERISTDLSRATITIHPIGEYYNDVVRIQLESAAGDRRNGTLPRLVWLPEGLQPQPGPQTEFIDKIHKDWAGNPFQIFEKRLDEFQSEVVGYLERPKPVASKTAKKRPSVYVLCSGDEDRKSARGLRAFLNGQSLEVGSATATADKHQHRLAEDDAFLIYYGQCEDSWVRDRVAEIADPGPPGRHNPVLSRAVFLADPETDDKLDLLTNDAHVLKGYGAAALDVALQPFLKDVLAESGAAGGQP